MPLFLSSLLRTALAFAALAWGATVWAQMETLRIQDYPGLGNILVRVAAANGYCEKHGIKCELKSIPAAPLGIQTLLAGDIDVAYGPAEVVIQAVNKGAHGDPKRSQRLSGRDGRFERQKNRSNRAGVWR
jgi:NitT/TauT family transport system substrate-binding protein